jgi:hypothetical protein
MVERNSGWITNSSQEAAKLSTKKQDIFKMSSNAALTGGKSSSLATLADKMSALPTGNEGIR